MVPSSKPVKLELVLSEINMRELSPSTSLVLVINFFMKSIINTNADQEMNDDGSPYNNSLSEDPHFMLPPLKWQS